VSHSLFPGRVIDIPVTVDSDITMPVPISGSFSHKHTSVQDEEEPVTSDSSWVWTNDTKVPVLLPYNPTDAVPVPALDADTVPRCSTRAHVPSSRVAETLGLQQIPCVAQAVAESREAGRHLKEQCAHAKFDWCQQVLDNCASLTNDPASPTIPCTVVPDDTLPPPPVPNPDAD